MPFIKKEEGSGKYGEPFKEETKIYLVLIGHNTMYMEFTAQNRRYPDRAWVRKIGNEKSTSGIMEEN